MSEERLQEIKDSVDFQREMLLARNLGTLCVDEEQELIDEIERLNNIIKEYEDRFKMIKKIVEDNILEELNSLEYSMMMSTISSVCDGKSGFLSLGVDKE